ncbi:MAG TPA: CsgG/HfaB family protein [Thermoanaerobaculia bacterium]|jgi:curli biogenesis system outer membrane secretion channel CsgG|nr:CsgG/HfaB family protein [Thermoanaerobaculia bacterium]
MRHRWCIAAVITVAVLGLALPSQAGAKDLFHPTKKQENKELMLTCIQQKVWLAYFKDDKENFSPVRDTMNTDADTDWLGLRFTNYDGPRIRLGVLKVINKSTESEENNGSGRIVVNVAGIQEMLTVALFNTKRFDVVEEKRAAEIKKEQTRQDVMAPSPGALMKEGKLLDAQYLVYGTVNEWTPNRSKKKLSTGSGGGGALGGLKGRIAGLTGIGGAGASKQEAEVSITFVLADVANGQELFTTTERARMGEWAFSVSGAESGGTEQSTPISYAVRACANKAALKIASFLRDRKWIGSVVDVKKPAIYINAGSQQGMSPDTVLSVFRVEGIVRDAEGRMILGEDLKGIGTLKVDSVQPGFSIAHVENTRKEVRKGDRVELATMPVLPPPPQGCKEMDQTLAP